MSDPLDGYTPVQPVPSAPVTPDSFDARAQAVASLNPSDFAKGGPNDYLSRIGLSPSNEDNRAALNTILHFENRGLNPMAVSATGDHGLFQISPQVGKEIGYTRSMVPAVQLQQVEQNWLPTLADRIGSTDPGVLALGHLNQARTKAMLQDAPSGAGDPLEGYTPVAADPLEGYMPAITSSPSPSGTPSQSIVQRVMAGAKRGIQILPELAYDFTVGPFQEAAGVFGQTDNQNRASIASLTQEQRAYQMENPSPTPLQKLMAPAGTYSDDELVRAMAPLTGLGMIGAFGSRSVGGVTAPLERGYGFFRKVGEEPSAHSPLLTPLPAAESASTLAPPRPVQSELVEPTAAPVAETAPVTEPPMSAEGSPTLPVGNALVGAQTNPLKPLAAGVETGLRIADDIKKTFAPASRGPQAQQMAGIVREGAAQLAAATERTRAALDSAEAMMDRLPPDEQLRFTGSFERGGPQPTPELQTVASALRQVLDQRRTQVQDLGKGYLENYIDNYYPHIWKDPEKAASVFAQYYGRRPLGGPESFLKQRTLPTIEEGMSLGLEPVSTNPVTMTLLKVREMDRFLMKERIVDELKGEGLTKFVGVGQRPPDGWVKIQDKAFRAMQYSEAEQGFITRGDYYAPEPAARVLNNYLSPGLQGNATYDFVRGMGNSLNQAQLGISAFHLGFTTLDSAVSRVGLGVQKLSAGQFKGGLGDLLSGFTPFKAPLQSYRLGNQMLKEFYQPGSMSPEIAADVAHYIQGGGRFVMDRFYTNSAVENFWKAWRTGQPVTAGRLAFPALVEALAKPTMEVIVPRMKAGVFADLSRFELSKLPPDSTPTMQRAALARVVDSVDNRLGQMVYDNLFWNRAMKDLGLASVRSLGWNLGTARELVGGMRDLPVQTTRALRGQGFEITPKMAYTAALPVVVGLYGGMLNYLMTGEQPQELKDYFFPRTGQLRDDGTPARVSLPSYMKDVYAYAKHPLTTLGHKVNPVISTVIDMLNNEDYYGAAIRDPQDPLVKQAADEFSFAATQYKPFSLQGFQRQRKSGASVLQALPSFVGVTPASASIERSAEAQAQIERKQQLPALRKKWRQERSGGTWGSIGTGGS